MSDLELLLEKVRTAEAGSRELDVAIEVAMPLDVSYSSGHRPSASRGKVTCRYSGGSSGTYNAPRFTRSVEAAAALIERQLLINSTRTATDPSGCSAQITWWPDGLSGERRIHSDEANASLPLAMVAALLSAKIQTGSGETGNE